MDGKIAGFSQLQKIETRLAGSSVKEACVKDN